MRRAFAAAALLLLGAPALAATLAEDVAAANRAAERLDRPWDDGFAVYRDAYRRKCGSSLLSSGGCLLTEEDVPVVAPPRPGRVLLFRGAGLERTAAARVSLWASGPEGRWLCGADCDYDGLSLALRRLGLGLVGSAVAGRGSLFYDRRLGIWGVVDLPWDDMPAPAAGTLVPLRDVPPSRDAVRLGSVMEVFVRTHVLDEGPKVLDRPGEPLELDPMVSFSADPERAAGFAAARLIVVSVPAGDVLTSPSACGSEAPARGIFLDVRACAAGDFGHEREYDAFLVVDGALIVDALRR